MVFLMAEVSGGAVNLTAVIVAGIGALGGILSYLQASAVRRGQRAMEQRKVDAEAYERARRFDQEVVASLRIEVERLNGRLREEAERLQAERHRNEELEEELEEIEGLQEEIIGLREALDRERGLSDGLRERVDSLEQRVARLRNRLSELGVSDVGDDDGTAY